MAQEPRPTHRDLPEGTTAPRRRPWGAVLGRWLVALVVTSGAAAVVLLVGLTDYRTAWGWSAVAVGALVGLTANDVVTRTGAIDLSTVFGGVLSPGPDRGREDADSLTGLGAFLLVGLPLVVLGFLVVGT